MQREMWQSGTTGRGASHLQAVRNLPVESVAADFEVVADTAERNAAAIPAAVSRWLLP